MWWGSLLKVVDESKRERVEVAEEGQECVLSMMVDSKPEELLTPEEKFDKKNETGRSLEDYKVEW